MGHGKKAAPAEAKFQAFGFLADHYPAMAKQAIAIQKKGSKATKAEAARLRTFAGWNTRYAKKAGFTSIPVSNPGPVAVHVRVKPVSMAKPKPVNPAIAVPDFDSFDVVQLLLTGNSNRLHSDYSPGAPVIGRSHYIVLRQKKHHKAEPEVVLLHPFTLTRFTVPQITFQGALLPESNVTPAQALRAMEKVTERNRQLGREIPLYVGKVQSALRKAVA